MTAVEHRPAVVDELAERRDRRALACRFEVSVLRTTPAVLAAFAAGEPERDVPVSFRGPYLSLFASPMLASWPSDVLDWLRSRVGPAGWEQAARRHGLDVDGP